MSKSRIKVASVQRRLPPKSLVGGNSIDSPDKTGTLANIDMSEKVDTLRSVDMTEMSNKSNDNDMVDDSRMRNRPVGRPRKAPEAKAVPVTITLWPEEYLALETLRKDLSQDLPVELPRSDLARLGISMLVEMKPQDVLAELVRRRQRSTSS